MKSIFKLDSLTIYVIVGRTISLSHTQVYMLICVFSNLQRLDRDMLNVKTIIHCTYIVYPQSYDATDKSFKIILKYSVLF